MELNKPRLLRITGKTLLLMALSMTPSLLFAFYEDDSVMIRAFGYPIAVSLIIAVFILLFIKQDQRFLKIRDGYMTIFIIIAVTCTIGAVPFYLGISGSNIAECLFESVAGFTTTSATVFDEPSMAHSLLLWKSIEHWTGGLIILIFVISILPVMGIGDFQIATMESHSGFMNKVAPKYMYIIKYICIIYCSFTVAALIYFSVAKIGVYDAVLLALTTTSTAGVMIHPGGISYYNSFYIEFGVTLFTLISSVNYVLYIHIYKKNFSEIKKNGEFKVFWAIIAIGTVLIGFILALSDTGKSLLTSFRDSFFQVTSFITTSGFALNDYTLWPKTSIYVLIMLMIIGGCAASTTGSIKIMRILVMIKLVRLNFHRKMHPRLVGTVRIGKRPITARTGSSITAFCITFVMTLLVSTLVLTLQNVDINTAFSAAIGTLSNSGISFGDIGMTGAYDQFHPILKIYLCLLMLIGRLGFFTIVMVFMPAFWNPTKTSTRRIK